MSDDGYDHPSARYRAMMFDDRTPEESAAIVAAVNAAFDKTFGVKKYTTTEGWLVGGLEGNGDANQEGPKSSIAWRQRVDKARREIETIAAEHRVRMMAESINRDEVLTLLEEIRTWANSLKKQTCEFGSTESTRHATN